MKSLIAFCGSKGSGKSTSASFFKEIIEPHRGEIQVIEEIAIAGHLKLVCSKVFDIEINHFLDPNLKEIELETYIVLDSNNLQKVLKMFFVDNIIHDTQIRPHIGRVLRTPRQLLQYVGTEVLHPIDPLIHIKAAMKKRDTSKITLITDLRFLAEFNFFKDNYETEFLPVYVKNPYAEVAAANDAHPSERQYLEFADKCRILHNYGSLIDLKSRVIELTKEL